MTDVVSDPLPPLSPRERHACLTVDTFCVHCGYNLQSQEVTRDERLGIFVCRCPECGRFHPAGTGMTAASLWAQRLGTLLLFIWILIVLFALFWIVMGMGVVTVVHVEDYSGRTMVDIPTGKRVEFVQQPTGGPNARGWQPVIAGTTQPSTQWTNAFTRDFGDRRQPSPWEYFAMSLGGGVIGFVAGLLLVVFLWHWPKRRYVWAVLLPLAVAGFISSIFAVDESYMFIRPWAIRIAFSYALLELAFMLLGIWIGRPVARGILRMFIPPRTRQHFAFLWRCDGKAMATAPVG